LRRYYACIGSHICRSNSGMGAWNIQRLRRSEIRFDKLSALPSKSSRTRAIISEVIVSSLRLRNVRTLRFSRRSEQSKNHCYQVRRRRMKPQIPISVSVCHSIGLFVTNTLPQ
jgi:hypothetical protein